MRSMKLDVPNPKSAGEKRYNAGLAYGACVAGWRAGHSSLPGSQQKKRAIRVAC